MLNCREVTRLVSESQERKLSITERLSLNLHLMMCDGCKNFSLQVPYLRKAMRAYAERVDDVVDPPDPPPARPRNGGEA